MKAPDFSRIPQELKVIPNWVLWNLEPDPKNPERMTKKPYQFNGDLSKNNDPATWSDYKSVVAAYELGGCSGIGFVFTKSCGINLH